MFKNVLLVCLDWEKEVQSSDLCGPGLFCCVFIEHISCQTCPNMINPNTLLLQFQGQRLAWINFSQSTFTNRGLIPPPAKTTAVFLEFHHHMNLIYSPVLSWSHSAKTEAQI